MVARCRLAWAASWGVTTALLAPASAPAQEPPGAAVAIAAPPPEAAPPPPNYLPRVLGPRVRFEVAIEAGILLDYYSVPEGVPGGNFNAGGGGGLALRLGAQIKDWLAVQLEGSGGFLVFLGYIRGAVTANFTPVRWFTVSIGPAIGTLGSISGSSSYAGITLRSDFYVYQRRTAAGRRHSFTLGLGGDLGSSYSISAESSIYPGITVGAMANIGYTLH